MDRSRIIITTICAVSTILGVATARAETPIERLGTGIDRSTTPEFQEPTEAPTFTLPEIRPEEQGPDQAGLKIMVKRFEILGNKAISNEDLAKITAPYEGRQLTSSEIQEVRRNITLYYINEGYINSGAILPDQKITDGVVKLLVVEGELTTIEVSGNTDLNSDYVSGRLRLGGGPPLNIKDMQDQLRFLQQNPLIKKVNAQLTPGNKPGESILKVLVEENDPSTIALFVNNYRSPSVGGISYGIEALHRNLTGNGDTISFRATQADGPNDPGLTDVALSYAYPLNAQDTTFRIHAEGSETTVVEKPFAGLDIESRSDTIGVELTHPVYRTLDTEVVLGIGFDKRKSRSFLLGEPFPFSAGTEDGVSRISVMRLIQNLNIRQQNQAFSLRSVFSFGLKALDSTIHDSPAEVALYCGPGIPADECPDSRFTTWLIQSQYARRITIGERPMSMVLRADAQLTDAPLLPAEQFSVGGARSVRGYRENQLVRDNGFVASAELRIPVFRELDGSSKYQLVPFYDFGRAWNENRSTPDPSYIASAGVGMLWNPDAHLAAELYLAKAFRKIVGESDEHDLQDSGIHFQVTYRF